MEQKREQTPQPPGKKENQPHHEPPGHPAQPQRGGASERPRQQPDPTRQHQSSGEIEDEYDLDLDQAGDERPGGHSAATRHQQQPDKAHKDF